MKLFRKNISSHGQKLYGPPEMLKDAENSDNKEIKPKKSFFSAKRNRAKCIYGPPEMIEARRRGEKYPPRKNNPAEGVYGPPEWFENTRTKNNVAEDVYGPPEMLGAIGYEPEEPDVTEEPDEDNFAEK